MWHIIFWFVYVAGSSLMYAQYSENIKLELISHLFYLPFVMGATYFTLYVLIPKFLIRRRIFLFVLLFLLSAPVFTALSRLNTMYFLIPWQYPDAIDTYTVFSSRFLASIPSLYFTVFAATAIKLFFYFYKNEVERQELAREKLDAEMKFLKAQIHPHFLFNTLNNLYVLAKKKSDLTAEVVMKLSEILRYILYDCNRDFSTLQKEIDILKNYIDLEKIRYNDDLEINFEIAGSTENTNIPPVLLLPLVENAFKHGTSTGTGKQFINISLKVDENSLTFVVINSKAAEILQSKTGHDKGIGLQNLRNRLELSFPGNYKFETDDKKSTYESYLTIPIGEKNANI